MKKTTYIIILIFITLNISAQIPAKIKFQAIARDVNGQPMINQQVSLKIKIRTDYMDGSIVYSESHDITSNLSGIIYLNIGEGVGVSGNLMTIDWIGSNHFIEVIINGTSIGITQIMAVPFAMHAELAEEVDDIDYENVTNKPDIPSDMSQLTDFTNKIFSGDYTQLRNIPAFSGSYNDLFNTPEIITSFSNLTDETGVLEKIDFYSLNNRPTFPSNSYLALINKPDIKTKISQFTDADNKVFSGKYEDLINKPYIFSGKYIDLTNKPLIPTQISEFTDVNEKLKNVKFADINPTVDIFDGNFYNLTDLNLPADIKDFTDNNNLIFDGDYNNLIEKPFISKDYTHLTGKPTIPYDIKDLTDNSNLLTNLKYENLNGAPSELTKLSQLTDDLIFIRIEGDGSTTNELQNIKQVLNRGASASGNRIVDLKDPANNSDIATKLYIDALEARYNALKKRVDNFFAGTGVEAMVNQGKTIQEIKNMGLTIDKSVGSSKNQENNSFEWIGIGDQIWTKKNIDVKIFSDDSNTSIPKGPDTPPGNDLSGETPQTYWFEYNNANNEEALGLLYTWNVITDSKNVCPKGWRVPTETDWNQLITFIEGQPNGNPAGKALKANEMWITTNGLDIAQLRVIPSGIRNANGTFEGADGKQTRVWLNTEESGNGKYEEFKHTNDNIVSGTAHKNDAYSVRCIKE